MQYFKDCKTEEEVKKKYREWAKKLHPDHGGQANEMIELQRQYDFMIKFGPEKEKKSYEFKKNMGDSVRENLKEQAESWGKTFESKSYGGYGGYKYNTNANMRQEYYNQRDDPRLAEYERMKVENIALKSAVNVLKNLNIELDKENESLKKKVQTQKRQLEKLKNPLKKKKKESKTVISL